MKLNLRDIVYTTVIAGALTLVANACDNYQAKHYVSFTDKKVSVVEKKSIFGNPKCGIKADIHGVNSSLDDRLLSPRDARFYVNGELYYDGDSIPCDPLGKYSGKVLPKDVENQINGSYAREE